MSLEECRSTAEKRKKTRRQRKLPKTIGRICEDCLKKIRACEHNGELR
jgi:hypothetical protein